MSRIRVGVPLAALTVVLPVQALGQEDFRAADLDRPIRVEDASPVEFRAWEVEVGSRGSFEEGARGIEGVLELKAGLLRNAQIGVEIEGAFESLTAGGGSESGLEAASIHFFYGLNRETHSLPALAFRLEASSPGAGTLRNEDVQGGGKLIATRSFGRARIHANGGYTVASSVDGGDYWRVGLGGDYPLGLFSRALLADVYGELPTSGGGSRVWAELGFRFQISNQSVLDVGIATRLDEWNEGNSNIELVVGLSRVFGLTPSVDPYPEPAIR